MPDACTCSCATTRPRRPSAAVIIASLALFMSLGGTSYAAVKANTIGSKQLKNNSVTSAKIARNGVTASDIRAGVIDGTRIRAGSIGSQHILDGSIGAQDITPGTVGPGQIAPGSIGPGQIADKSVGPSEIDDATIKLFRDVPTMWVTDGSGTLPNGDKKTEVTLSTTGFTTVRSYSVPAAGTGRTGTTVVQSQVTAFANAPATVECYVYVAANSDQAGSESTSGIRATSTAAVPGRVVVPVSALIHVAENNVVQTRCRAVGAAEVKADVADDTGATSMTLMRVGD